MPEKNGTQSIGQSSGTTNPAGAPTITDITSGPTRTSSEAPTPEEFGRFEHLASKLVQVPKSELDEKRGES